MVEPLTRSDGAILQARNNADDRRGMLQDDCVLEPIELVTEKVQPLNGAWTGDASFELSISTPSLNWRPARVPQERYDFALAQGPGKALALRPGFQVIWLKTTPLEQLVQGSGDRDDVSR